LEAHFLGKTTQSYGKFLGIFGLTGLQAHPSLTLVLHLKTLLHSALYPGSRLPLRSRLLNALKI